MLEINKEQIDVVRRSGALCDLIREQLSDPSLSLKDRSLLSDDEWAKLEDACLEVLRNEAPIVKEIDAEQSKGVYTISIHGIPGAYWIFAPEFDVEGVFSTLEEALAEVDSQHGEFLVADDDEKGSNENDEELTESMPEAETDSLGAVENAIHAPTTEDLKLREQAVEFVKTFEMTLPRPRGYIEGMTRGYKKLPRLINRVELYLRQNGKMPDPDETMKLFDTE